MRPKSVHSKLGFQIMGGLKMRQCEGLDANNRATRTGERVRQICRQLVSFPPQ